MVYGLQDLQVYRSYDEAWLVPVLFPLAPAVILNMVLLYALVRQRCCSSSSVARASCPPEDKAAAGILGFDCVFSICCLAQCIVNYANREYSGGDFACQVQGVYSTFYVAGELPMAALVAWASYSRCATGVFPARLGPSVVGIYAQAIVLAFLPAMFGGEYFFKKDYCMWDLENNLGFALITALLCGLSMFASAAFSFMAIRTDASIRGKQILLAHVVLLIGCWWPLQAISIDAVFNGDLGRDGWPFAWGYGLSAVLIHLRHLLNPILYGWLWRRWASQLSASTSVIVTAKQQEIDEEKSATECGPQQPKAPGEVGV